FTPKNVARQKIKKGNEHQVTIELGKTTDILATLGQQKRKGQVLVGFALETDDGRASAEDKLRKKNLDFIVLNSTRDKGAGFTGDRDKITIIDRDNSVGEFAQKPKVEVARDICARIVRLINS